MLLAMPLIRQIKLAVVVIYDEAERGSAGLSVEGN